MKIKYKLFPSYLRDLRISYLVWEKIKKMSGIGGIIKGFYLMLREDFDPPIWNIVIDHSNIMSIISRYYAKRTINGNIFLRSGGVGLNLEEALWRSIGEVVERYCWYLAGYYYRKELIFGSYKEIKKCFEVFPFNKIYLFSESQYKSPKFPFSRLTPSTRIYWIPMFDILSGREILYPAQLILPLYPGMEREPIFGYSTTSGISASLTLKDSIVCSFLEQVERDAFLLTWYGKRNVPKISLTSEEFKSLFGFELEKFPCYSLTIFDITMEDIGIPTILAILTSRNRWPPLYTIVGASSNFDIEQAIYKAILETFQAIPFGKRAYLFYPNVKKINLNNITDFDRNFIYYLSHKSNAFEFLFRSAKNTTFKKIRKKFIRFSTIIKKLKKYGWHFLVLDLTLPDVQECGFYVTKVLIPELVQLSLPSFPFFAHPRYKKVDIKNKLPHPLP